MRLIDADRLIEDMGASCLPIMEKGISEITGDESCIVDHINAAPTIDAVPVDIVADMLAYMFNDECPCNYNDIDEWLPYVCENTETCPDVVGKHSCWKQFIKHWMNREGEEDD